MPPLTPRDAATSLPCPQCADHLHIARSCQEVYMYCPACRVQFPLAMYIAKADKTMESFLENVYCDRI